MTQIVLHKLLNFNSVYVPTGRYQTGPAPLRAIKEGNVKLKHDVRFIFAEVNADTVYWSRLSPDQEFRPIRVDRRLIGIFLTSYFYYLNATSIQFLS